MEVKKKIVHKFFWVASSVTNTSKQSILHCLTTDYGWFFTTLYCDQSHKFDSLLLHNFTVAPVDSYLEEKKQRTFSANNIFMSNFR